MTQTKKPAYSADNNRIAEKQPAVRETFLDFLRIAAACAVVLLHTVTGITDITDMTLYPKQLRACWALRDLTTWCVPVFLMISGYLFLRPGKRIPMKVMLTKYCRRIALALLVFGIPYAGLELLWNGQALSANIVWESIVQVLSGQSWAHLWYLYLILVLYFVTPVLQWILVKVPFGVICLFTAALFLGCSILPAAALADGWIRTYEGAGEGIYLFYYLAGGLFARIKRPDGRQADFWGAVLAALAVALAGADVWLRLNGSTLQLAYHDPLTVELALVIFDAAFLKMRGKGAVNIDCLRRLSELSFAVYLIHPVFLNLLYKVWGWNPLEHALFPALGVTFAGVLLLSFGAAVLLRRVPLLKKYVL